MELIEKCASLLEISAKEIEMEKEPFATGVIAKSYMAKWRKENVIVKIVKANSEEEKEYVKCEANPVSYTHLTLPTKRIV